MALKLYERYPQLWESPSNDYPQGAFKNLSAQGETDGSYLEKDWLNDYSGFFGALLRNAEMTPDGTIDTAQRSQFYDALVKVAKSAVADQGYATTSYVDNKFNEVPKTEIINDWDQASDENVFSAGFVSKRINQDADGNTIIKSGSQTFTFPRYGDGGEIALKGVKQYSSQNNVTSEGVILTDVRIDPSVLDSSTSAFLQSIVYDYRSSCFYASADLGGGRGNVIHKIKDTGLRWTVPRHGLETSQPTLDIGHQGLGIFYPSNEPTLILPKGRSEDRMHYIYTKKASDIIVEEGFTPDKVFKVFDESESRGAQSNTVGSSGCHNYFVVHGADDVLKMAVVKVFKTSLLEGGSRDISPEYISKFYVDAFRLGTGKIGIQSITTDGTFVYLNIYDTGVKNERLLTYNLDGLLVSDEVIRTAFQWRESESSSYYEPEGLFWYRYAGELRLCLTIVGNLAGGLRKNLLVMLGDDLGEVGVYSKFSKLFFKSGKGSKGVIYRASGETANSFHIEGVEGNVKQSPAIIFRDYNDSHPNKGVVSIAHGCDGNSNAWTVMSSDAIWTEGKHVDLGRSSNTFKDIYLANAPTVTSDANAKFDIEDIDGKYMRVMARLNFKQFKLKAGTSGRTHFGIIAQEWIEVCEAEGVDPKESGVLVGNETEGYAIRYTELLVLHHAYLAKKLENLS